MEFLTAVSHFGQFLLVLGGDAPGQHDRGKGPRVADHEIHWFSVHALALLKRREQPVAVLALFFLALVIVLILVILVLVVVIRILFLLFGLAFGRVGLGRRLLILAHVLFLVVL